MAKLFYSIEEASEKLGKSESELRDMASKGEITEFRDGDRLIFKKDQIDLLVSDADEDTEEGMSGMIPLADSGMGMSAGGSDAGGSDTGGEDENNSNGALEETKEATSEQGQQSGISIFDADSEQDDPSAVTQVSEGGLDTESLDSFAGDSGAIDLSGEGSGADLAADSMLGELYSGGSVAGGTAVDANAGGLFEGQSMSGGAEQAQATGAATATVPEAYDGRGSWMATGLAVASILTLAGALAIAFMGMSGVVPEMVYTTFDGNVLIFMAIAAGVALVLGGLGFMLGGDKS